MVEKMPEAAKLYFENWDVLDTARKELLSVYEDFWPSTWPIIQERAEAANLGTPRLWENRASLGMWVLNSRAKAKKAGGKVSQRSMSIHTGIEVSIFDPRQSKNPSIYSVRFRCSAANLKKLNKDYPGAQEKIDSLSKQHSLELNWKEPRRMCVREISVDPDDLGNTWEEVADAAVELLSFLHEVEAAIGSGD